jgi:hypothetical protein
LTELDPVRDLGFHSAPGVANSFSGRLVVCGSARCLWDDLAIAKIETSFLDGADFMAIKQVGMYLPQDMKPRHWAGCHGERFQWLVPLRRDGYYFRGRNGERQVHPQKLGIMVHADKLWPMVDHAWPGPLTGTSSLFGVRVGLALGYEEVLLCGVPLDDSGRFYDAPWDKGVDLNVATMDEWEQYMPALQGRVKSMSGRTRELLGAL